MSIRILLLLILAFSQLSSTTSAEASLTAAFIRDHQLWLKKGDEEIQLTKGQHITSPKWSFDGRFLAYLDRTKTEDKSYLFIYDLQNNESYQPYFRAETFDFKWSPIKNQLAYLEQGLLKVTKTNNSRPQGFESVSLGVSGFEWFPNGKDFIVSSQASLHPTGWGPVSLYRIPVNANLDKDKMNLFYIIQTNEADLFAITAEYFKWSYDGSWLSFLATPTASWSMDSNTLCVLTSKGKNFHAVGKMLRNLDWMKWSPHANQIAYISGEGRFLVENKQMTIADMPTSIQQKEYTPKGYVDLDLEWFSKDLVIVARAQENKEWKEGPVPTMYTSLYSININTTNQHQISFPKQDELDEAPQVVGSYITWFRKREGSKGGVWVKEALNGQEYKWITNVDYAPVFLNKK